MRGRVAELALVLSILGACQSADVAGSCRLLSLPEFQRAWCEQAHQCVADGYSGNYGPLGASVDECAARDDIGFLQILYAQLGGAGPAEQYRVSQPARFFGCEDVLWRASCSELEANGPLLSDGGYCSAAYLKGEPTGLPDRPCNDVLH